MHIVDDCIGISGGFFDLSVHLMRQGVKIFVNLVTLIEGE